MDESARKSILMALFGVSCKKANYCLILWIASGFALANRLCRLALPRMTKKQHTVGFTHPITKKAVIPTVVEESVEKENRCLNYVRHDENNKLFTN